MFHTVTRDIADSIAEEDCDTLDTTDAGDGIIDHPGDRMSAALEFLLGLDSFFISAKIRLFLLHYMA